MKKIIIVNARCYCGGTIVLSLLCKLLQEHGVNSKILYIHKFPEQTDNFLMFWFNWFVYTFKYNLLKIIYLVFKRTKYAENKRFSVFKCTPVKDVKEKLTPFYNRKNTIVIYPEVIFGNILYAKNVVRYLLFNYKYSKTLNAYSKSDFFICFRDIFNDKALNPNEYKLQLNYFDFNLYKQYNFEERRGNCYIIRKGRNRKDLPASFDGDIIDTGMEESKIVEIFNKNKYCFCYDTQTLYTIIAAVCGCIPIVMLEPGKTKNDYLGENERLTYGVAYGNFKDEIDYAIRTRGKLLESLNFSKNNEENILRFIDLLNEKF